MARGPLKFLLTKTNPALILSVLGGALLALIISFIQLRSAEASDLGDFKLLCSGDGGELTFTKSESDLKVEGRIKGKEHQHTFGAAELSGINGWEGTEPYGKDSNSLFPQYTLESSADVGFFRDSIKEFKRRYTYKVELLRDPQMLQAPHNLPVIEKYQLDLNIHFDRGNSELSYNIVQKQIIRILKDPTRNLVSETMHCKEI